MIATHTKNFDLAKDVPDFENLIKSYWDCCDKHEKDVLVVDIVR